VIIVEWTFLVGEAKRLGVSLEEMVASLENDPDFTIVGRPDSCHCGKPEAEHKWISESELNEWRPQEGFKKNSCARKPKPRCTEHPLELVFKIWSPADNPCDEDFMKDISS
jgi:hypothetical protein